MLESVSDPELWQVNFGPGDTRTLTLEQVDAAYQAGVIEESTLVCEVGSADWQPLYVVAGLEPPAAPSAPLPAAVVAPTANTLPFGRPSDPPLRSNGAGTAPASVGRQAPPSSRPKPTQGPPSVVPRPSKWADNAPPAGAPSPPARPAASPAASKVQRSVLPSAKAPPLPPNYMASSAARGHSGNARSRQAAPTAATVRPHAAAGTNAAVKTSAKVDVGHQTNAARDVNPSRQGAPRSERTAPAPAVIAAAAPAAITAPPPAPITAPPPAPITAPPPPASAPPEGATGHVPASSQAPTVRGKAPPLPPHAFAHLSQQPAPALQGPAIAHSVGLPFLPNTEPGLGAAPGSARLVSVAPAAPAPQPRAAVAAHAPVFAAAAMDEQAEVPLSRPRSEWVLIAGAAVVGLLIILHRNGLVQDLCQRLSTRASCENTEKTLLGEPSIETPRGVDRLLRRTERSATPQTERGTQ
jgi:hypothetical protein